MRLFFLVFVMLFASVTARAQGELDLNTATVAELDGLPGIGRSKAEAIVRWREQNGPFGSVEDLREVKGFGAATVRRLDGFVTVRAGGAPAKKVETPPKERPATKDSSEKSVDTSALDREAPAGKLNVNLANEEELQELDGVSRANAKVIVAWRKVKGPFRTVGAVARVPGVPEKMFETVKYFLTTKLDVSNAMETDLVALGVDPDGAKALVAAQRKKPLRSAADLERVAGISEEERESLGALLWFGE